MIIVTVHGSVKLQCIINPKRVYEIVVYGRWVYESEMYSKMVYDDNKPFFRVYYSTLFFTV